ncbi:pyridoxine 5'-phosphate synthase [bacterium]|nr:pyridoxine 5'-phosphate synthase [bacterium]
MAVLGVNVDHVATLREARGVNYPDPVAAGIMAEMAGASLITVHLREDRRHIRERDVEILRQVVKTRLNLEMAAVPEMVRLALSFRPDEACLVPEKREELTTEGGLDCISSKESLKEVVGALGQAGIIVSIFIDPDPSQIKAAKETGAPFIEIHTGRYCEAKGEEAVELELKRIKEAVEVALDLGLRVNGGHGLNYQNVIPVARIPEIEELNIGHSIVARAVMVGMEKAVREMLVLIR